VIVLAVVCWLAAAVASAGTAPAEQSLGRSAEYDYDPPRPGTYTLPPIQPAGDGDVLTADGKRARLRDVVRGQITLLSFIYTRCADPRACPMATGALYTIHDVSTADRDIAANLRLVTFSFDPEHDTPTVMSEYGSAMRPGGVGCEWLFLTTRDRRALEPILKAYGQRVDPKKNPLDPLGPFYHVLRVYLIDREGVIRNIYSYGMLDPRVVLADVRTLLLESATAKR
jgi:cytochrome oxidase Cu insertion factor (SCO1/SenC/PrrC family)